MKTKKYFLMLLSFLMVASLVLVACGGGDTPATEEPMPEEPETMPEEPEEPSEPAMTMVEVAFPVMPGVLLEKALAAE